VEYRQCKLTIPVGALPETLFVEIGVPDEAPRDVIAESAYQINPDSVELERDALLAIRYYDEDVPAGHSDEELVIVHSVDGVWVELSNSRVMVHNNTVEAPVRYLGLYALRLQTYDPRRMNTMPVADFEFSTEPYPEMVGKPLDQAQKEMTEQPEGEMPPAAGAAGETGSEQTGGEGDGSGETGTGAPPEGAAPPGAQPPNAQTGFITERRVVAGPEDPPGAPQVREEQQDDTGAGNVAEGNAPPSAESAEQETSAEQDRTAAATRTIYFNASASHDPDGQVVQYDWDFDADGVFDYTSHSSPYAKHSFRTNGDFSVVLKVSDNGRYTQAGYTSQTVEIRTAAAEPAPLAANIAAYPPFGPCPLTVHYASSISGGTPPYIYRWKFSDNSESTLPNPSTTYTDVMDHLVHFSVTDITGETLSGTVNVRGQSTGTPSTPLERMLMDINPTNARGYAPYTAKFSLSVERATEPVVYRVSFGDEPLGAQEFVTSDPTFMHMYPTAGFYLVKVIATDAELRTASTFATVNAVSPDSAREFTATEGGVGGDPFSFGHGMSIAFDYTGPQQSGGGRTVRFHAANTPLPTEQLAFNWDFGDGTYSTEPKPEHTYAKDSIFEVRLTAGDQTQRWRHRIWLPVSAKEPAAAIQRPSYIEGPAPFSVFLDAIVTRGEQPFKYDWYIGDARRSDPTAFYTFEMPGEYSVKLDVLDKYNAQIHAPKITVRVRPSPAAYRQPLAVVEPISGSTRALVLDYTAANPLPLSSSAVEGAVSLVDLSADGQLLALVTKDGLLVKRVSNGEPVLSFLPAGGQIVAVAALEDDAALATVETAGGLETYLATPPCSVQLAASGLLLDASGDGSVVLLKAKRDSSAALSLLSLDVAQGRIGQPQGIGTGYEGKLSRDGRSVYYINADQRLVRREVGSGTEQFLSGGEDRKSGLVVAGDGDAVAFVSNRGDGHDIIYGRASEDEGFRLASVTDQTGFFSEQLGLSADGRFLLAYGSRKELLALLSAARDGKATDKDLAAEDASAEEAVPPTQRRERFGIIRLDLSAAPTEWNISIVNPRFIWEASAQFSSAGPF
jgi:hypothetical protein